uniref:LIM zinc-binding domain-containing protein n=1 Tax=Romanomermis culicivorax TaxID=13658 RepID=A0A915KDV8_ROMCU
MLDFRDLESINMLNFQPNQIKAEISNDLVNKSQTSANIKRCVSVCKGCGQEIYDQYILRVAPDLEWHAACLKCVDCQEYLDERCTCYVKETKVYCKADYLSNPRSFYCNTYLNNDVVCCCFRRGRVCSTH